MSCDPNIHFHENPRWRTPRKFHSKYLKNQARYEKAINVFVIKACFKRRIFSCAEPNVNKLNQSAKFALDSAHEKFDV